MMIHSEQVIKIYGDLSYLYETDFYLQKSDILHNCPLYKKFKDNNLTDLDWAVYWSFLYAMYYYKTPIYTTYEFKPVNN